MAHMLKPPVRGSNAWRLAGMRIAGTAIPSSKTALLKVHVHKNITFSENSLNPKP